MNNHPETGNKHCREKSFQASIMALSIKQCIIKCNNFDKTSYHTATIVQKLKYDDIKVKHNTVTILRRCDDVDI